MHDVNVNFNGAMVLWSITGTADGETVNNRLKALGLPPAATIDEQEALRLSMQEDARGRLMVRPLAQGVGYALVQESDDGTEMQYDEVYRAIVVDGALVGQPGEKVVSPKLGPAGGSLTLPDVYRTLNQRHGKWYGQVNADKLGACLTNAVRFLGGVAVRHRGGVYWLADEALGALSQVAQVVEAEAPGSSVFRVKTVADEQTVRLVSSSLSHEVETEAARIQDELQSGDLGERAIETRRARLDVLQQKVEDYESLLGETMDSLKDRLEEVGMARVVAELTSPSDDSDHLSGLR